MIPSAGWQIEDRNSRHVRRTRLCVSAGAPRHRLVSAIEEALRLAALPGENEGRTYFFRRLRLTGLPADGDRRAWLDHFQRALTEEAADAVHGADPRADLAPAVFFRSRQEALEILLHRILTRRLIHEWFWPMVTAAPGGGPSASVARSPTSSARMIPAIVEQIRSTPASWVAVAAALFAAPSLDAVYLLDSIPASVAEVWLREMAGLLPPVPGVAPRISPSAQRSIGQASRVFGFEDSRTLWLATLGILLDSPAELMAGTAVWRGRTALHRLVSEGYAPPAGNVREHVPQPAPRHAVQQAPQAPAAPAEFAPPSDDSAPSVVSDAAEVRRPFEIAPTQPAPIAGTARTEPQSVFVPPLSVDPNLLTPTPEVASPLSSAVPTAAVHATPVTPALSPAETPLESAVPAPPDFRPAPAPWYCSGMPTNAAGLFFLLNALQRIGIAQALPDGLAGVDAIFVARLLQRLAAHAGVAPDDPIRLWVDSLVTTAPDAAPLACDANWWPSNLRPSRTSAPIDYLLRVWCLAVRRWCWRTGKLTVPGIVSRPGVFSVNRTDLDVSLPLDEADVRVRRVGLDLDPGWLPWFGRVVRFHYLYRGEFNG